MEKITITTKTGFTLDAWLIREENPRIALCQDRLALLNSKNEEVATRDLLFMFTTTERVGASYSQPPTHRGGKTLELRGEMGLDWNDANDLNDRLNEADYWDGDASYQE